MTEERKGPFPEDIVELARQNTLTDLEWINRAAGKVISDILPTHVVAACNRGALPIGSCVVARPDLGGSVAVVVVMGPGAGPLARQLSKTAQATFTQMGTAMGFKVTESTEAHSGEVPSPNSGRDEPGVN